jgi:HAD superfamily hydrolase (TIGR01549 family)
MVIPVQGTKNIEAILFDMNGTLRRRESHPPTQRAAVKRMLDLLGLDHVPDAFWEELERRTKGYGTLAWKETRGRMIPQPDAEETLLELKRRGYRLGVISNSMSSLDIPRSLETFGWKDFFEVVILASMVKCRKPAPEIFWEATSALNIEPTNCAYLGNRISRDVVGCKRAGFALGIIIETPGGHLTDELDQTIQPDVFIHSLKELLDLFQVRAPLEPKV